MCLKLIVKRIKNSMRKPKIKIFVSHRIDLDSKCVKNPLYCHMRCGAVDDKRENIKLAGDNTGDNISDKHDYLSEFTVQYWAWKNYEADYYGICHYRRYLSFANQEFPTKNHQGLVEEGKISSEAMSKYFLKSHKEMRREIQKYDVIFGKPYSTLDAPVEWTTFENYHQLLKKRYVGALSDEMLDLIRTLIREMHPEYLSAFEKRLESTDVIGFCCFVMKKQLFFEMCQFEFDIMGKLLEQIDVNKYVGNDIRIIAYIGELLYGTFIERLRCEGNYKLAEKQVVLFRHPERSKSKLSKASIKEISKKVLLKISPTYRVARRIEERQLQTHKMLQNISSKVTNNSCMLDSIMRKVELSIWLSQPLYPDNIVQVKERFWRSLPSAEGDTKIIQAGNMCMLRRMKQICDDLGIRFWLDGGTLIGGLRHDGLIPWDDDIDVCMMRDDFAKLKQHLENSETYKIQDIYYTALFCRSYRFMRRDVSANSFVDVFVFDFYSPTEKSIYHDWGKLIGYKKSMGSQYSELVCSYGVIPNNQTLDNEPELKEQLDKLIDFYCSKIISEANSEYIAWGLDNSFGNSQCNAWKNGRIFHKSDIFPLKECHFENEIMYIPSNYQKYLFVLYESDYLDMPKDMFVCKHTPIYYSKPENIENVKYLIEDESKRGV